MADFAYQWYVLISQWSSKLGEPLLQLLGSQSVPAVSALLLGLLGGLAPCQVSANAGAIAYVTQTGNDPTGRSGLWRTVRDYVGGKMVVYLLLGFLAAMLGLQLPTPVMAALRKLSGPLMIVVGLYLLGIIRWESQVGSRVTEWLRTRMPRRGSPPFWLGVAFSLGFCPTMAVIFFGTLVPIVVQAPAGVILPAIFAVGTAVPVLLWALALWAGREAAGRWVRQVRRADRPLRWIAAAVLLIVGLNDTLLYWFT